MLTVCSFSMDLSRSEDNEESFLVMSPPVQTSYYARGTALASGKV